MAAKSSQFLKFTDKNGRLLVDGECIDARHRNEIDCTDWSWDVQDPSAKIKKDTKTDLKASSGTASRGKSTTDGEADDVVKPSTFSFSKKTDKSTTRLLGAMDRGEVFPIAVMSIEEEFEAAPMPFEMEIILTDVFVVKFDWRVSASDARADMEEDWQLNYREINIKYLWRGKPPGTYQSSFRKTADSSDGASEKSPPSVAEQRAAKDREMADWAKRNGWKPPGKS